MNLFIIGNGFDLFHNLETAYKDYKAFLENPDLDNCNCYTFVRDDEKIGTPDDFENLDSALWKDLEGKLNIELDSLQNQTMDGHGDIVPDDLSIYDQFTGAFFVKWVNQISIDKANENLPLPQDSLFLSFNYTLLLEKHYNISEKRIFHVHGKQGNQTLQFGNSAFQLIEPGKAREILLKYIENHPTFTANNKQADDYLKEAKRIFGKDPHSNFKSIEDFLFGIPVDRVIVIGLSLSEQDMPYFDELLLPKYKDRQWMFVCYDDDDRKCKERFANEKGLSYFLFTYEDIKSGRVNW